MSDKGKKIIQLFIFLALGIFFIWISLKDLSAEQKASIIDNIKGVAIDNRWIFLILSAAIGFISVIFRAFRSIQLIEPLGYNVSKINSYHSVMICYIANIAFPRLGEVLRCTFIQRYEKVPFQKTFGTVVTERIIDMLSFGLIFLFALLLESEKLLSLFQHKTQSTETTSFLNNPMFILAIILLLVIIILFIFRKSIVKWKLYHKIKQIILGFWSGLLSVVKLKKPLLFVFYTFMIWVCYFFMFYVAIFAFPEIVAMGNQLWMASLSCVVIGTIGFIISQGGLGAYPLLISSVLLLYGISKELGLAVGWVVWTTETLLYVVGGIISLIIAPFTNPKKIKMNHLQQIKHKIISKDAFSILQQKKQFATKKIVFTNGCFDILHRGHVEYLAQAAALGDMLIIGLNSDSSIKRIKGDNRPIMDETSRAILLASLSFVDYIILFEEDTPYSLIKLIQPDILIKGSDYTIDTIVGADIVKAKKGEIITIDLVPDISTSIIINKIKEID